MDIRISKIVNTFSLGRIKYGWYSCNFISTEHPIFIGGCPRSGTTLLYSIINSHPKISLGFETGILSGHRNLTAISKWTGISLHTIEIIYKKSCCYPEFSENVLKELMLSQGKQRWGDKSPVNVTLISDIFKHFPNSKFIHIIRDGRDVICSMRNHSPSFGFKYGNINPWSACISKWIDWVQQGIRWRGDTRYYDLKYEDLILNPKRETEKIMDFLGEKFYPDMLSKNNKAKIPSHPEATKNINTSRLGRWKKDLPKNILKLFYRKAGSLMKTLEYEL